jgi:hypothetical protein
MQTSARIGRRVNVIDAYRLLANATSAQDSLQVYAIMGRKSASGNSLAIGISGAERDSEP